MSNIFGRGGRLAGAALALTMIAVGGCRRSPDMGAQPSYRPYQPSEFFVDGSSARPLVPGTVARNDARIDPHRYQGLVNGQLASTFPFAITAADLQRGRERYNIYCAVCHGQAGYGDGMIVQRGLTKPPSYHEQRLRDASVGHFFDVITHGYGAMFGYAARVEPDDRWRIIAYIRALQLSQHAEVAQLPTTMRSEDR